MFACESKPGEGVELARGSENNKEELQSKLLFEFEFELEFEFEFEFKLLLVLQFVDVIWQQHAHAICSAGR